MKSKLLIAGSILSVLAGVFFTGCGEADEVKVVGVDVSQPAQVSDLKVVKTDGGTYYLLTWTVVENAGGYGVYVRENGKIYIKPIDSSIDPYSSNKYAQDNSSSSNDNYDNYYYRVDISGNNLTAAKYDFGVVSKAFNPYDPNSADSDPAWVTTP